MVPCVPEWILREVTVDILFIYWYQLYEFFKLGVYDMHSNFPFLFIFFSLGFCKNQRLYTIWRDSHRQKQVIHLIVQIYLQSHCPFKWISRSFRMKTAVRRRRRKLNTAIMWRLRGKVAQTWLESPAVTYVLITMTTFLSCSRWMHPCRWYLNFCVRQRPNVWKVMVARSSLSHAAWCRPGWSRWRFNNCDWDRIEKKRIYSSPSGGNCLF